MEHVTGLLQYIASPAITIGVLAYFFNRMFRRQDAMDDKLTLLQTQNARDHGEVKAELHELRARVDAIEKVLDKFPSPWDISRSQAHKQTG